LGKLGEARKGWERLGKAGKARRSQTRIRDIRKRQERRGNAREG